MANKPLRVLGFAFTEMSAEEWNKLYEGHPQGAARTFEARLDKGE
jgi:hypothetical protein|tara:strand:- start:570 stop:704 length:135 start_codon:yes stop_codon:yes gene_type:complete